MPAVYISSLGALMSVNISWKEHFVLYVLRMPTSVFLVVCGKFEIHVLVSFYCGYQFYYVYFYSLKLSTLLLPVLLRIHCIPAVRHSSGSISHGHVKGETIL